MTILAITITALVFLKWYYIVSIVMGVFLVVFTAIGGPIESGPITYLISLLFCIGLLLCVLSL